MTRSVRAQISSRSVDAVRSDVSSGLLTMVLSMWLASPKSPDGSTPSSTDRLPFPNGALLLQCGGEAAPGDPLRRPFRCGARGISLRIVSHETRK